MSRLSGFSHRAGEATVDESRRETTCRHRTVHVPRLRKARTWRRAARAALGVAVVVAAVVLVATDARAQGVLENPQPGAAKGGIGVLSGWKCTAGGPTAITLTIDEGTPIQAAYGTSRTDTIPVCGDANNGWGVLFNFGLLADGEHEVVVRDAGVEFARATFSTSRFGVPFLSGASGLTYVRDFPTADQGAFLVWEQASQSFQVGGTCGFTGRPPCPPAVLRTAWGSADQPAFAGSYTPSGSLNSATQPNSVSRIGTGSYRVTFGGLGIAGPSGIAHVSARGAAASSCVVSGWFAEMGAIDVDVRCFDATGADADTAFDVVWTRPAPDTELRAYLWASDASAATAYEPDFLYQYNVTGALNTVERLSVGTYRATLPGIASGSDVGVMVSAYGGTLAHCRLLDYGLDADGRFGVDVECRDAAGAVADAQFTLSVFREAPLAPFFFANVAYLRMRNPEMPEVGPLDEYNSTGAPNTVSRLGTGRYAARLGMMGSFGANGNVHLAAVGTATATATHCNVEGVTIVDSDAQVTVQCWNGANPAEGEFLLTYEE